MRRQPVYRRSAEANCFYPEHAPNPEAPYIHYKSASSRDGSHGCSVVEDVGRMERRQQHCLNAAKERERMEEGWKLKRQNLEKGRKKDKYDAWLRMQKDKDAREARWVQKTTTNALGVDLWEEDQQIYGRCQAFNAKDKERQRQTARSMLNNSQSSIKAKIEEVDVLGGLRKEKKKLQMDQKELKARLDLDKVDKRLFNVKVKEETKHEAHQEMLAGKGHLDRSHSDFFTEQRLSPQQRLQRASSQPMFSRGPSSGSLAGNQAMFQRVLARLEGGSEEIPVALLEHAFVEIDIDGCGSLQLVDLDDALEQCGSPLSQSTMHVIMVELNKRAEQDEINTDMGWTEFVEFFRLIEELCRKRRAAAGQQDIVESSGAAGQAESSQVLEEPPAKPEEVDRRHRAQTEP